jgi:hypothetical protein
VFVVFEMRNKDELGRKEGRKKEAFFDSFVPEIKNERCAKQEPFPSNLAKHQTF